MKKSNSMDVKTTKLELVQMILNTKEESILERIKQVFAENQDDWWDLISNEERAAIEEGLSQLDSGKGVPHKEVMDKVREKFKS